MRSAGPILDSKSPATQSRSLGHDVLSPLLEEAATAKGDQSPRQELPGVLSLAKENARLRALAVGYVIPGWSERPDPGSVIADPAITPLVFR